MQGFKHIIVDKLPSGWQSKYFSEIADFRMGKTPPRSNDCFWKCSIYSWVSIADMKPFGTVTSTKEKISEQAHKEIFHGAIVPPGSLLMSFKLSIGRMAKLGIAAYHNEAIISFQPNNGIVEDDFLFYYLGQINYRDYQDTAVKGQTLNKSKLAKLEIALPPLPEQRKITAVLALVQRAIEQQERLLQLTGELKKTLLNQLFTEGLRNEPQKQTEIGLMPKSWEVVELGTLATIISKGSSPRWQGFEYVPEGVLFVRSQNVGAGRMEFVDRVFLPPEFNQHEKRSVLMNEDILVNLVGASIGRIALGTSEIEGANCNQAVGFVRLEQERSYKALVVFYLLSPSGQQQIFFQKKDIARANLSLLDLRSLKVPIPAKAETREIVQVFEKIERRIEICDQQRETLTDLFRTLLHQLMTAQIRVHDIDLSELESQVSIEPPEACSQNKSLVHDLA